MLVVDDERIVAEDLSELLIELGYDVVGIAADAERAVELARAESPDLVFMDIVLRGERDGISAAAQLREELGVPCVFASAYSDADVVERATEANPAGYLIKPFDKAGLRALTSVAVKKVRAERELERALAEQADQLDSVRAQLVEAQKMEAVGTLTGGIAHDFNNMLLPIIGYAQLIEDGLAEREADAELRAFAGEIRSAAGAAAGLTRQLLAFSRRQVLRRQVRDVHEVVGGTVPMLDRVLGEGVCLQVELMGGEAPCLIDAAQLEQALVNLAVNARDALDGNGAITIRSRRLAASEAGALGLGGDAEADWFCLSLEDDGPGIPEEMAARVFEPFFSTKGNMGTGLGLAVVHGIVTQHDGEITVGEREGGGARFDIYLPLVVQGGEAEPAERERGEASGREGYKILVIEDEPQVRMFVARALGNQGYHVATAYDLASARQQLDRVEGGAGGREFDLIFSDCVLPDGNGAEFLREELQRRPWQKAILTTGYTEREALERTADEHQVAFLQKPYPLPQLFETISNTLREGDGYAVSI